MLKHFVADEYVKSVFEVDLHKLKQQGKKVILTDLDNTLVGTNVALPTPEIITF